MSTPAVTSSPPSATGPTDQLSVSVLNSLRVAAIVERLSLYFVFDDPAGTRHPNGVAYCSLLLSLARGIDYAVANNDIPDKIEQIPELLKEICHWKSDASSLALVMVLMISVKNACNVGWFPEKEKQELLALFDDIGSFFYNPRDIYCGTVDSQLAISTIFARFYPQLRMGETITSLEVKPGYGTFLRDFHISKDTAHSPEERIRLLVAQTDNMETSACIISPPQVNFLLNGKAVVRRTNIFMDAGPQMPTNVTSMLKYGTNLLQAVGQFDGHYVIALAFMSVTLPIDSSGLKDYISPTAVSASDSDPDLVVGPSRVSLNCPISRSRIQVPVKGQSCKHPQSFDFSNFVNINSRQPTWRCPHCHQYVWYTDLRIDQNIAKILKDVGNDITDVMISDDGSWKAIMESDGNVDTANNKISDFLEEAPEMQGSTNPPSLSNILDLTVDGGEMDAVMNKEDEDRKPSSDMKNTCAASQDLAQPEDNFWSGDFVMPTTSNGGLDPQVVIDGAFEPPILSNLTPPSISDAISPVLNNQGVHGLGNTNFVDPIVQNPFSASNSLQLQQPQLVNSILSNEYGYGSRQSIPMNVARTSITVQGLPASHQTPNLSQRANYNMNSMVQNSSPTASPATLSQPQQQLLRCLPTAPPPSFCQTTTMQGHQHSPAQLFQQALNRSAIPAQQQYLVQLQGTPRASTGLFMGFQNPHLQMALNNSRPPPMSHSPITTSPRCPSSHAETPLLQIPTTTGLPHSIFHTSSQQANPSYRHHIPPQVGISPPPGFRLPSTSEEQRRNIVAGVQPSLSGEGSGDMASEQNWRPTGRMRGSLTGRPLTGEIGQLVIQPTQLTRPRGPSAPSNPISATLSAPPHLRASISNNRNTSTGNAQNN